MRILVTGIGGDIGYGIGKILRMAGIAEFMLGCDVHDEHAGRLYFDRCVTLPRADSSDYVESLKDVARSNRVNLIVPASEPEQRLLHRLKLFRDLDGVPLLMANERALDAGFDKQETTRLLQSARLPHPWTQVVRDGAPRALPCIVKARYGAGSRGVARVDSTLVALIAQSRPDDLWQELLEPADQEYTCGLFRARSGETRSIVIHRRLVAGSTRFGRVHDNQPAIEGLLAGIADALDLVGSINVQLVLTSHGPVPFEINPRFSSTLVFRHILGFQDVVWSIEDCIGKPLSAYHPPQGGSTFYRGTDELIFHPAPNPERTTA